MFYLGLINQYNKYAKKQLKIKKIYHDEYSKVNKILSGKTYSLVGNNNYPESMEIIERKLENLHLKKVDKNAEYTVVLQVQKEINKTINIVFSKNRVEQFDFSVTLKSKEATDEHFAFKIEEDLFEVSVINARH